MIRSALAEAGVETGDAVLAHSSLSSFGRVDGGADAVIDALLDAVGREGTVMVPTHTWDKINLDNPVFDVRETPSCVGAITNVLRQRARARRSLHPTHSCAGIGPEIERYLAGHETDLTPCGPHSPYARLMEWGGKIAFLGTGLACNTTLHALEEYVCVPYLFDGFHDLYSIDYDGRRIHVPSMRHSSGLPRRFRELGPVMETAGIILRSKCGNASIETVDARGMKAVFAPLVAKDRFYLLTGETARKARHWYQARPKPHRHPT